ncbi:MAG: adenosylhomocysteinase [Candidatus Calescibacterium sp.]|nr:adenosylhomocysteinase [Candidatus Calescibacterium sp.]
MPDIKDIGLADLGKKRVEWASREMPVLKLIREEFRSKKPFKGIKIGCCLHVTTETANLVLTLKEGGADVSLCASNPLSTQDDAAAFLVKEGIDVYAIKGESNKKYYEHIESVILKKPDITIDDGCDLTVEAHKRNIIPLGGTEETTTGVIRLRSMEKSGNLKFPVIAVNDAQTKHLFDNRYGTGQSTIDGILRATNILLAGKKFVVAGYGMCGKGVAIRARGMGAHVIVVEVDPIRALEAVMDGFEVMDMDSAATIGDVFVTVTGNKSVITIENIKKMKDGAILSNSGHFDVEIEVAKMRELFKSREIRPFVEEFDVDGKKVYLLAQGRLVNLAAAEGHPSAVMDMSFANQSLSALYILENHRKLEKKVYKVPDEIDRRVAELKLKSMGIKIQELSEEQRKYLSSWEEGT